MTSNSMHRTNISYWKQYAGGKFGQKSKKARESALDIVRTLNEQTPCEWCGTPKPPAINLCHSCMRGLMFCRQDPSLDSE